MYEAKNVAGATDLDGITQDDLLKERRGRPESRSSPPGLQSVGQISDLSDLNLSLMSRVSQTSDVLVPKIIPTLMPEQSAHRTGRRHIASFVYNKCGSGAETERETLPCPRSIALTHPVN